MALLNRRWRLAMLLGALATAGGAVLAAAPIRSPAIGAAVVRPRGIRDGQPGQPEHRAASTYRSAPPALSPARLDWWSTKIARDLDDSLVAVAARPTSGAALSPPANLIARPERDTQSGWAVVLGFTSGRSSRVPAEAYVARVWPRAGTIADALPRPPVRSKRQGVRVSGLRAETIYRAAVRAATRQPVEAIEIVGDWRYSRYSRTIEFATGPKHRIVLLLGSAKRALFRITMTDAAGADHTATFRVRLGERIGAVRPGADGARLDFSTGYRLAALRSVVVPASSARLTPLRDAAGDVVRDADGDPLQVPLSPTPRAAVLEAELRLEAGGPPLILRAGS